MPNEDLRIILSCALNTSPSGGCMRHVHAMTGMASGNTHWTVY